MVEHSRRKADATGVENATTNCINTVLGFRFNIKSKQRRLITDLIQSATLTSYVVTLLVLSVHCCWVTSNLHQQKKKKKANLFPLIHGVNMSRTL